MDYEEFGYEAEAEAHKQDLADEEYNARLEAERMAHWDPIGGLEGYDPFAGY